MVYSIIFIIIILIFITYPTSLDILLQLLKFRASNIFNSTLTRNQLLKFIPLAVLLAPLKNPIPSQPPKISPTVSKSSEMEHSIIQREPRQGGSANPQRITQYTSLERSLSGSTSLSSPTKARPSYVFLDTYVNVHVIRLRLVTCAGVNAFRCS